MSLWRWLLTFLAFPFGGLLSMLLLGGSTSPTAAAVGGLVVGSVVGCAQWLALGRRVGATWLILTALAVAGGSLIAWLVVGAPTSVPAVVVTGALTGALVGTGQAFVLRVGVGRGAIWLATTAITWAIGWAVTAAVIVDIDRGHFVFGSSGAAVVTLVTGVVLRLLIGPRPRRAATQPAAAPSEV